MRFARFTWMLVLLTAIAVVPACSKKTSQAAKEPRHLTEAQRDSAIAASQLPGASVVGRALEQSDSAKARANQPIPEP